MALDGFSTTSSLEGGWALITFKNTTECGCTGGLMNSAFAFAEGNDICTEWKYTVVSFMVSSDHGLMRQSVPSPSKQTGPLSKCASWCVHASERRRFREFRHRRTKMVRVDVAFWLSPHCVPSCPGMHHPELHLQAQHHLPRLYPLLRTIGGFSEERGGVSF